MGGSGKDSLIATCEQQDGAVVLVWSTTSCDGWMSGCKGGRDIVVTSLNAEGGIRWQFVLGGNGDDDALVLARDWDSYFLFCRSTSTDGPLSDGSVPDGTSKPNGAWVVVFNEFGSIVRTAPLSQPDPALHYVPEKVLLEGGPGVMLLAQAQRGPASSGAGQEAVTSAVYYFDHTGKEVRSMHLQTVSGDYRIHDAYRATPNGDALIGPGDGNFYPLQGPIQKHWIYFFGNKTANSPLLGVRMESGRTVDVKRKVIDAAEVHTYNPGESDLFVLCMNEKWEVQWVRQYPHNGNEYAVAMMLYSWSAPSFTLVSRRTIGADRLNGVASEWRHLEDHTAQLRDAELDLQLIDRKGIVSKEVQAGRIADPRSFRQTDMGSLDDNGHSFACDGGAGRSSFELTRIGDLSFTAQTVSRNGIDLWLPVSTQRAWCALGSKDRQHYVTRFADENGERIGPTTSRVLPPEAHIEPKAAHAFDGRQGLQGFATTKAGDIIVSVVSHDSKQKHAGPFKDQVLVRAWGGSLEASVPPGRRERLDALTTLWERAGQARSLQHVAFALEASNDLAAASYFHGLCIAASKTTLSKDSLALLHAHELACRYFATASIPVKELPATGAASVTAGVLLTRQGDRLMVVDVLDNSAAQRAGLWPGDLITHVNGIAAATDLPLDSISRKLTGTPGTVVVLRTRRFGRPADADLRCTLRALGSVRSSAPAATGPAETAVNAPPNYNEAADAGYVARDQAKTAILDSAFRKVATWDEIRRNAALLQRVIRCLEIIDHMAKDPVDAKALADVGTSLGLVATLAELVAERKQGAGARGSGNAMLKELAQNTEAQKAAEEVAPTPAPVIAERPVVELEGGTSIVESRLETGIAGEYEIVERDPMPGSQQGPERYNVTYTRALPNTNCTSEVFNSYIRIQVEGTHITVLSNRTERFAPCTTGMPGQSWSNTISARTTTMESQGSGEMNGEGPTEITGSTVINSGGINSEFKDPQADAQRAQLASTPTGRDFLRKLDEAKGPRTHSTAASSFSIEYRQQWTILADGKIRVDGTTKEGMHYGYSMQKVR